METVWSNSPHLKHLYIEVEVNDALGVVVLQEERTEQPRLVFCSLFENPKHEFYEVRDRRSWGVTIDEVRQMLDAIEAQLKRRPFSEDDPSSDAP